MTIKIEKNKTDQLRQGDEIVITHSGGSVCSVLLMKDYLKRVNIEPNTKEFIFRPLVKTKSSHKLVKADKSISYSYREHLTKSLRDVVSDPSAYTVRRRGLYGCQLRGQ